MNTKYYGDRVCEDVETVTDANEVNVIEMIGKCVISIGCTNVVNNLVKWSMPYRTGFFTEKITKLGGTLIGFAVGDYISDYTFYQIHKAKKEFERFKDEGGFV